MFQYTLRRLLVALPSLLGVLIIVFLMVRLAPGDPALLLAGEFADAATVERIRERFGLDDSYLVQFQRFITGVVQGDLGRSTRTSRLVTEDLADYFPNTVELAAASIVFALLVGVGLGIVSALRSNTWVDALAMVLALVGVSMPTFWFALLAIRFFSVEQGWFPVAGHGTLAHLVLPAVTLGLSSTGIIARMTRSALLEVLGQDYVRTARAKGVPDHGVTLRHALRNALLPVVTVVGLEFGGLLGGAVLTETVFAWPGVGRLLVDAITSRDLPLVQGAVLFIAVVFILVNLLVDLSYALLNPRVRYD